MDAFEEIDAHLNGQFCLAANTLTEFYKQSMQAQRKAYLAGVTRTVEMLGRFLTTHSASCSSFPTNGSIAVNSLLTFLDSVLQDAQKDAASTSVGKGKNVASQPLAQPQQEPLARLQQQQQVHNQEQRAPAVSVKKSLAAAGQESQLKEAHSWKLGNRVVQQEVPPATLSQHFFPSNPFQKMQSPSTAQAQQQNTLAFSSQRQQLQQQESSCSFAHRVQLSFDFGNSNQSSDANNSNSSAGSVFIFNASGSQQLHVGDHNKSSSPASPSLTSPSVTTEPIDSSLPHKRNDARQREGNLSGSAMKRPFGDVSMMDVFEGFNFDSDSLQNEFLKAVKRPRNNTFAN